MGSGLCEPLDETGVDAATTRTLDLHMVRQLVSLDGEDDDFIQDVMVSYVEQLEIPRRSSAGAGRWRHGAGTS